MSLNTVRKHITQLEDKRLIKTLPTTVWTLDGTARNGTLLYTILPIHEAVNYHLEGQLVGLPMRKGEKRTVNPNPALCGPVCDFEGRDREMTPAGRVTSPVGVVWGSCGQQLPKASLEKPTDTKYPSFPTEKHRASLSENPNKANRRYPAPPPLGGGVNSFWGEKPNSALCGDLWPVRGRGREATPPKPQTAPVGPA